MSSPSSAYCKRCYKGRLIGFNFSQSFSSVGTLSKTSNDHALYGMLNHGNTLVQLLHCIALSSCQLESTLPPTAQLLLSQSWQGHVVGPHLWLSNFLERISRPSCELLYATNTSHCKQETFIYKYLLHWVFSLPTKCAQQNVANRFHTPQAWSRFWPLKPACECAHVHLLPRRVMKLDCGAT
jgi:hypothetical protein